MYLPSITPYKILISYSVYILNYFLFFFTVVSFLLQIRELDQAFQD